MSIRVLLVDDHPAFLLGLSACLQLEDGIEIVGQAGTVREALDTLTSDPHVEVLLTDLFLPDGDGIELIRSAAAARPRIRSIVLSAYRSDELVASATAAGARGFITKECTLPDIADAIRCVAIGQTRLGAVGLGKDGKPDCPGELEGLTPREREALELVVRGLSTQEMAKEMHIKKRTADKHRQSMMGKLRAYNRLELTGFALRNGVVFLSDVLARRAGRQIDDDG